MRKGLAARIVARIKFCPYVESVFRRELLDEATHLSITNNRQAGAHALSRPVARSWVAMRA